MRNAIAILLAFSFQLLAAISLNAQNSDSLELVLGNNEAILHEHDIQSWDWERQNLKLRPSAIRLGSISIAGDHWTLVLGEAVLVQGLFGEDGCSECLNDSPLVMMYQPTRRVTSLSEPRLHLFFFESSQAIKNPLYNPILLDHLVKRNLIPAEYRLRMALKAARMGWAWPKK